MSGEEAIRIIKECKEKGFKYTFYTVEEYHTALDMAIKAVEKEPCEDVISRQAAIDEIRFGQSYVTKISPTGAIEHLFDKENKALEEAVERIEELPSVYAEPTRWIPVSERFPEENGDYLVTYEKGYAEDYDLGNIGIAGFEVDCESFGYWYEHFDRYTLGSLGSEWEKIEVIAWMPLPKPYEPQERSGEE